LGHAFFPGLAQRWGSKPEVYSPAPHPSSPISQATPSIFPLSLLPDLRHPFIVSENHAQWGAEMASAAGASPLAVALIRRHQEEIGELNDQGLSLEGRLLLKLQSVDDNS
jgi:hypothetical protein